MNRNENVEITWNEDMEDRPGVLAISDGGNGNLDKPPSSHVAWCPNLDASAPRCDFMQIRSHEESVIFKCSKSFWSCINNNNNKNMSYDIPGVCRYFFLASLCVRVGVGNFMYSCVSDHQDASILKLPPKQGAKPFTIHVESASVWTKWFQSLIWGNSLFRMHHPSRL